MDTDSKLNVLFDYISDQGKTCTQCTEKIGKQGKINTGVAAMMGFVGGLVGYFGHFVFGKP
jgi:hypothetical protein